MPKPNHSIRMNDSTMQKLNILREQGDDLGKPFADLDALFNAMIPDFELRKQNRESARLARLRKKKTGDEHE